jgi:hypothetical protein
MNEESENLEEKEVFMLLSLMKATQYVNFGVQRLRGGTGVLSEMVSMDERRWEDLRRVFRYLAHDTSITVSQALHLNHNISARA